MKSYETIVQASVQSIADLRPDFSNRLRCLLSADSLVTFFGVQKDCHIDSSPNSNTDCNTMVRYFQPLLFMLAAAAEEPVRRQFEYLKAENEMLRRRVTH